LDQIRAVNSRSEERDRGVRSGQGVSKCDEREGAGLIEGEGRVVPEEEKGAAEEEEEEEENYEKEPSHQGG
jgi:hypothetical protein